MDLLNFDICFLYLFLPLKPAQICVYIHITRLFSRGEGGHWDAFGGFIMNQVMVERI